MASFVPLCLSFLCCKIPARSMQHKHIGVSETHHSKPPTHTIQHETECTYWPHNTPPTPYQPNQIIAFTVIQSQCALQSFFPTLAWDDTWNGFTLSVQFMNLIISLHCNVAILHSNFTFRFSIAFLGCSRIFLGTVHFHCKNAVSWLKNMFPFFLVLSKMHFVRPL